MFGHSLTRAEEEWLSYHGAGLAMMRQEFSTIPDLETWESALRIMSRSNVLSRSDRAFLAKLSQQAEPAPVPEEARGVGFSNALIDWVLNAFRKKPQSLLAPEGSPRLAGLKPKHQNRLMELFNTLAAISPRDTKPLLPSKVVSTEVFWDRLLEPGFIMHASGGKKLNEAGLRDILQYGAQYHHHVARLILMSPQNPTELRSAELKELLAALRRHESRLEPGLLEKAFGWIHHAG